MPCPGAHLLLRFVGSRSHRQTENPWPGGVWVGSGPQGWGWKPWGSLGMYRSVLGCPKGRSLCHHDLIVQEHNQPYEFLWIHMNSYEFPFVLSTYFGEAPEVPKNSVTSHWFWQSWSHRHLWSLGDISSPHFGLVTHPSYSQTFKGSKSFVKDFNSSQTSRIINSYSI